MFIVKTFFATNKSPYIEYPILVDVEVIRNFRNDVNLQ